MARDAYVAIAHPTRREILSFLLDHDVVAAGDVAAQFGAVSRPAISRHLRVLRECGVVISFKTGKTQNYTLNPKPINEIRQGWLKGFAAKHNKSLRALRRIVEADS